MNSYSPDPFERAIEETCRLINYSPFRKRNWICATPSSDGSIIFEDIPPPLGVEGRLSLLQKQILDTTYGTNVLIYAGIIFEKGVPFFSNPKEGLEETNPVCEISELLGKYDDGGIMCLTIPMNHKLYTPQRSFLVSPTNMTGKSCTVNSKHGAYK